MGFYIIIYRLIAKSNAIVEKYNKKPVNLLRFVKVQSLDVDVNFALVRKIELVFVKFKLSDGPCGKWRKHITYHFCMVKIRIHQCQ